MTNKVASVGCLTVLALAALFPAATNAQQWDSVSTREVAPGVIHKRLIANRGPWRVNVLEIDLRQKGLALRGVKAKDSFIGRETVLSMASRYTGPGKVIAALNTDFFDVRTGESENNVVIEGRLSKGVTVSDSPHDTFNTLHSQFAVDWENHPFIDRLGLTATLRQGSRSFKLGGINFRTPWPDALVLYTSAAGDSTPADTTGRKSSYVPLRQISAGNGSMVFRVAGKMSEARRASLASGGVLIADGMRRRDLESIARNGGTVRVTTGLLPDRGRLRTVVGGWPRIVREGKSIAEYVDFIEGTFPRFSAGRHPRTAVGFSRDSATLYLLTVDGRRESDAGMTLAELANAMIQLGAYEAMNFDGGGSTTMVVEGQVVNKPSDRTGERPVGSGLLIVVEDPRTGSH